MFPKMSNCSVKVITLNQLDRTNFLLLLIQNVINSRSVLQIQRGRKSVSGTSLAVMYTTFQWKTLHSLLNPPDSHITSEFLSALAAP